MSVRSLCEQGLSMEHVLIGSVATLRSTKNSKTPLTFLGDISFIAVMCENLASLLAHEGNFVSYVLKIFYRSIELCISCTYM